MRECCSPVSGCLGSSPTWWPSSASSPLPPCCSTPSTSSLRHSHFLSFCKDWYLYIMMMLKRFSILKVIILLLARYILFNVPVHARTIPEVSSWFSSSNFLSQVLPNRIRFSIFNLTQDESLSIKKMAEVYLNFYLLIKTLLCFYKSRFQSL